MIIYPVYRKPEKETAIRLCSVSARASLAEEGCGCLGVGFMAVRAGVHRDEIFVFPGMCMGIRIISALCPVGLGIEFRGLIYQVEMMASARSQSCNRNGADQHQCTDESQRLFHGITLLK